MIPTSFHFEFRHSLLVILIARFSVLVFLRHGLHGFKGSFFAQISCMHLCPFLIIPLYDSRPARFFDFPVIGPCVS